MPPKSKSSAAKQRVPDAPPPTVFDVILASQFHDLIQRVDTLTCVYAYASEDLSSHADTVFAALDALCCDPILVSGKCHIARVNVAALPELNEIVGAPAVPYFKIFCDGKNVFELKAPAVPGEVAEVAQKDTTPVDNMPSGEEAQVTGNNLEKYKLLCRHAIKKRDEVIAIREKAAKATAALEEEEKAAAAAALQQEEATMAENNNSEAISAEA